MKKWIAAAGLAVILASSVSAAEPTTLTDKADKLDSVIFGDVQTGSFIERVDAMDEAVYGRKPSSEGLNERVSALPLYTAMWCADRKIRRHPSRPA